MKIFRIVLATGLLALGLPASANPSFAENDQPMMTLIHEIQGSGSSTPLAGQEVSVEAIVVGDFQNNGGVDSGELRGFFIQEEDRDADGDSATSEGIFVFDGSGSIDVATGDLVRVVGMAGENFGMTQISAGSVNVLGSNQPLPTAAELSLPVASVGDFEAYEGMLTRLSQSLVISEYFNFDRFGEIVLALPLPGEQRPMTPTAVELPGSAAFEARSDANARSRITLDDGRTNQNPDPALHPNGLVFDLGNRFRGGDLVQGAQGVIHFSFGLYRLQPTRGANYIPVNPRPELPPLMDAGIKVAAFNVLNYFSTLDTGASRNTCGPDMAQGCRGADNAEEFMRQRDKIIAAIAAIDADIVGLIEIENNAGDAVDDLLDGLNLVAGAGSYAAIDTGFIGADVITVAFIYQPDRVAPSDDFAILDGSVDPRFIDTENRPVLAQTFTSLANAGRFTVAVNHFKSKGSDCDDLGDPDTGDGQGNCNLTRSAAAAALVDWLASDPTGSGDSDSLIIGDLNAYDKEDPIAAITAAGYTDLVLRDQGELAYSFVFSGQFGYLDHALANRSLEPQAVATDIWRINADEPDILDYDTSFKRDAQDALYEANAFRSSDHDPVIVGLDLSASIEDIGRYIGQAIGAGALDGVGSTAQQAQQQLRRFVQLVDRAARLAGRGRASCSLLTRAERLSDGQAGPRDAVEGEAAPIVASMIAAYREQNCS